MTDPLTERQTDVLAFIRHFIRAQGVPPTIREIGEALGLKSTGTIHAQLDALERAGAIAMTPNRARGIRVTSASQNGGDPAVVVDALRRLSTAQPLPGEGIEKFAHRVRRMAEIALCELGG